MLSEFRKGLGQGMPATGLPYVRSGTPLMARLVDEKTRDDMGEGYILRALALG